MTKNLETSVISFMQEIDGNKIPDQHMILVTYESDVMKDITNEIGFT